MKNLFLSALILITASVFSQRQKSINTFEIQNQNNYQEFVKEYFNNLDKNKTIVNLKEIPKYDRPDLAAEFEYIKTVDPSLGYVPRERLIEAQEYAKYLLSQKAQIPNVTWQERGPNNVGGRTRALMFDPNDTETKKVWAGSVSGGLWYNNDITDASSSWQNVDDFWANISISFITYDPNSTNTFYVGTGEGWSAKMQRGAGIWKSTDAGASWNQLSSTIDSNFYYTQKIVITSTSRIVAAENGGLYISDDDGASWTQKMPNYFSDVEIAANGDIYAGEGKSYETGHIYKSTDNGDSWTDISPGTGSPERIELACAPSNANVVYAVASNGGNIEWMKKTTNAGTDWESLTIPDYLDQGCNPSGDDFARGQAWYDLIMIVHPTDEDYVLAGGIDIHRTTDGGTNWESISYWTGACATYVHADQHAMVYRPGYNNEAIFGTDGGIFYCDDVGDNGNNFVSRNHDYNVTQYYACAAKNEPASNYFLAGAQDNGSQRFTQVGINTTTDASGGDGAFCFIDQDNPDIQITSYVYNYRYISTDGGGSFNTLTTDYSGSFICPADYDSQTNILYSSYEDDQLMISDIGTSNYGTIEDIDSLGSNSASNIKVSPYTNNTIFVGTYGGEMYKISNANTSPVSVNIDINSYLPDGYISGIDIGESENHLLITYSNYGVTSVWETTDGGNTWIDKEGNLPDMPIRWCIFNPFDYNQALLATDVGVWSVDDLSSSSPLWEPTVSGLSNVRCDMLKYRDADDLIAVATYGRGLFTTDAFGSQDPIAQFEANVENACLLDTIVFTDISTHSPTDWTWTITPTTFSFVNGTDVNSQNPEVIFNNSDIYTIELYTSNLTGNDTETKTNFITIDSSCEYAMTNGSLYTCDALFYDPGYTDDYPAGQDFVYTIYPSSPNSNVKVQFNSFNVEYDSNCIYDYLEIYNAENTSSGFIGQYCGTNNPGTITASNPLGALTFYFHADGGVEEFGWDATVSCEDIVTSINENSDNSFRIYPNPANTYVQVESKNLKGESIKVFDITGKIVKSTIINSYNEELVTIDISDLEKGVYFIKINSSSQKFIKL
jgi:photosystem II stability/assembly factor-like uncharacterized protein